MKRTFGLVSSPKTDEKRRAIPRRVRRFFIGIFEICGSRLAA
jgi:hypothetical protein